MASFASTGSAAMRGGARGVVLYKGNDLRVADHLPLLSAHRECESVNQVLCLDPRDYRNTLLGYEKKSLRSFGFLQESIMDLKLSLQEGGSDLDVLIGRTEEVIPAYCASLLSSSDNGGSANFLYCHDEIAWEEKTKLKALSNQLRDQRVPFSIKAKEYSWGGTLFTMDDLNFNVHTDLQFFTNFRKKVEGSNLVTPSNLPVSPTWPESKVGTRPNVALLAKAEVDKLERAVLEDVHGMWSRLRSLGAGETQKFGKDSVSGCDRGAPALVEGDAPRVPAICESAATHDLQPHPHTAIPFTNYRGEGPQMGGGERAAQRRLHHYVTNGTGRLSIYKETRNGMLGADYSSKLSVYLALGTITARQVLKAVKEYEASSGIANQNTYWLIFELLWRDYMRLYLLKHDRKIFYLGGVQGAEGRRKHPWGHNDALLDAWREGRTGYPLIDANMRELKATGFMSNRGRQIVASFLVRDLKQDWRYGAEWFESRLLDHDVASNWGNWQYAAGVGADPREDRYFNVVKQGKDYDPDGQYIRAWCPEIAHLPNRVLLDPRTLTDEQRTQLSIDETVLPKMCVRLAMESFPPKGAKGGRGGGRGGGGRGGGRGGRGGASKAKKQQQHGFVPGRA
jgi:deoxyribodipyrimidine photo-lyase